MKKYYLLLLLVAGMANAQTVTIPDANFKMKLLLANSTNGIAIGVNGNSIKIDVNNDNQIQVSEALLVHQLNLNYGAIGNMTGIAAFTNLRMLYVSNNNFQSLDVSMLTNLEEFTCSTLPQFTTLNVSGLSNLKKLSCHNSPIVSLDLSGLTAIESLDLLYLPLTSVNVNGMLNLQRLALWNCEINSLDLTNVPALTDLSCYGNNIGSLSLANVPGLESLNCGSNNLNSIDLNGLSALKYLWVDSNNLSSLSLNAVPLLESLSCYQNNLVSLDLSMLPNLHALDASSNNLTSLVLPDAAHFNSTFVISDNNFTSLDLSDVDFTGTEYLGLNNNELTWLSLKNGLADPNVSLSGNPGLQFICTDEPETDYIQGLLNALNYTNCVVNSYCSFTPGGDYNTIAGKEVFDLDNNGCGSGDILQSYMKINITDGTTSGATFTNSLGDYKFYTQAGTFTLTPQIENPLYFNVNPISSTINFPVVNNSITNQDYCITANGIHQDLEIVIAPVVPARPGFETVYKVVYRNKGNTIMSLDYGVSFFYNHNLMSFVSADSTPDTVGPGALSWNYSNLKPFESRSILVTMQINPPTDLVNPVNIGDELVFNSAINPIGSDENQIDNYSVFHQNVVGSFDPNDIQCIEGNVVSPTEIGNYLHYIIRFENTGNAAAENIVVKAEINPNDFDISSLQLLNASHAIDTRIRGNVAEFIFDNIMLESGGHGNILLKVKSKSSLITGDSVNKKANIFFDYNFPVVTNEAATLFQTLSIDEIEKQFAVKVYPNPTESVLTIKGEKSIKSIQLFDVQGRVLMTKIVNGLEATIETFSYSSGTYFLRIETEKGSFTQKILKK